MNKVLFILIFSISTNVKSTAAETGNTKLFREYKFDKNSLTDWEQEGCGIESFNGLLKMCINVKDTPKCYITSKLFDFKEFPGESRYKVTVENSKIKDKSSLECSCTDPIEGSLTVITKQGNGEDTYTFSMGQNSNTPNVYSVPANTDFIKFKLHLRKVCYSTSIVIKIFYFVCAPTDQNLVTYPTTVATKSAKNVSGACAVNAVLTPRGPQPTMTCYPDGNFDVTGSCICDANYELDNRACAKCKDGYFKPQPGNEACRKCEDNSKWKIDKCVCIDGYARAIKDVDEENAKCWKLPKKPTDLVAEQKTHSTLRINWASKSNFDGKYVLQCLRCSLQKKEVTKPGVMYTDLRPNTLYEFVITVENKITEKTGSVVHATFKTKTFVKAPKEVEDLTFSNASRILTWSSMNDLGNEPIYAVDVGGGFIETNETFVLLSLPQGETLLTVKIYVKVTNIDGEVLRGPQTTKLFKITDLPNLPPKNKKQNDMSLIIGGAGAGGVLFILIIIIVVLLINRHRKPRQFEVTRMEDGTMTMPRMTLFKTSRLYIDPTTYSHVDDAVEEFTLELDRGSLTMDHLLGGGEFANVFKGILSTESRNSDVAIKVMKNGASRNDRDDFLSEAAILGQFSDPNVITIEGVVLRDHPNLIVLEFMANGSLDKYLVKNDSQFSIQKLLGMARGVSSGMKYLSELGFIHRDLAARNILVNTEDVCKIADFGMSRELKTDDTYDTKGGKIPIKWTAPESIEYKKFTTASDVWSYGVLLWEIFSYGERPYWEWTNLEVMERLSTGYRLPPPMECPKVIHDMMLHCWHKDRLKRPRFTNIFNTIEEWLKNPDQLKQIASVITKRDEDLDYSLLEDFASWLTAINMSQYLNIFMENDYNTPKDILGLTNEDLEKLGIALIGHRKKLLKAIKNTKNQSEAGGRRKSSSSHPHRQKSSKVKRSTSFAGFGTSLSKKVSFLGPNSSIAFKKTLGKRPSLNGYTLQ